MPTHDLRVLQIQVSKEQASFLPGITLTNLFESVEFISTISSNSGASEYLVSLKYSSPDALAKFIQMDDFKVTKVIEEYENHAIINLMTYGPLAMLIHENQSIWLQTPTTITRHNGLFLTIHGTTKGLKQFRDDISSLLPTSIKIRISKDLKADWIAAPQLPTRRKEVMDLAVEMGYYSTPRKCTQRDLADFLGVRQGTVAEHLQSAESIIIQSWSEQAQ